MPNSANFRIVKVGRDARTGKFMPVRVAQRRRQTAVVETYRLPLRRATAGRSLRPAPPNTLGDEPLK